MTAGRNGQGKPPGTLKPESRTAYARRFGQLRREAARTLSKPVTSASFINWLIEVKRPTWSSSSWRQNRAAARFGLGLEKLRRPELTGQITAAIAQLESTRPAPPDNPPLRTSQQKSKRIPPGDHDRICNAALASSSPNRQALVDLLVAGAVTGLRLAEWPSAQFGPSPEREFAWQLIVRNGKHDDVRAHGEFRTLRWTALGNEIVSSITAWIAVVQGAERDGTFSTLVNTLQALMRRLTMQLFPRRLKRPALYTGRHEAIARWKAHYVESAKTVEERIEGLATVAALAGHASDETATTHYGRPHRGEGGSGRFPVPVADRAEVARVRRRMQASLQRLAATRQRRPGIKR
jgi:hypothetical protein